MLMIRCSVGDCCTLLSWLFVGQMDGRMDGMTKCFCDVVDECEMRYGSWKKRKVEWLK